MLFSYEKINLILQLLNSQGIASSYQMSNPTIMLAKWLTDPQKLTNLLCIGSSRKCPQGLYSLHRTELLKNTLTSFEISAVFIADLLKPFSILYLATLIALKWLTGGTCSINSERSTSSKGQAPLLESYPNMMVFSLLPN